MKFPEPKTFRGAMSPAILFSWACGCGIFEFPSGHPRPVLSLFWSSLHFVVYLSSCLGIIRIPILPIVRETPLIKYYYYINSCFGTMCVITSIVGARKIQKLKNFHHRLKKVNKNLQKNFGIPEDYGAAFKCNLVHLIVAFINIIIITFASGIFIINAQNSSLIIFWISRIYQIIYMSTLICTYCGLISFPFGHTESFPLRISMNCLTHRYISNRFQQLNAYILELAFSDSETIPFLQSLSRSKFSPHSLIMFEIHGDLRLAKAADIHWKVYVLREVRSIHHELCMAAEEINRVFGIQIVFVMGMSIYNITSLIFGLYLLLTTPTMMFQNFHHAYFFYNLSWFSFFLTVIFYIVHCSSMVSDEAQKIGKLMYEVGKRNKETQDEINAFSIQLLKNPLKLTANGFFVLDYKMICAVGGLVSTYLVILIQMHAVSN